MKKLIVNLSLLAAVMLVCVAFMEVAVRIVMPQHASWFALYDAPKGKLPFELQRNVDHTIDTGDATWRVLTDDRGFRVGSEPVAPADAPLLLVVGDSFGFAYGVDYEQSFAHHVDVATGTTARVLNVSVPGFGPVQHRLRIEETLEAGLRPTAVLLQLYGGNDWADCVWDKNVPVVDGALSTNREGLKGAIKRSSHLYRLIAKGYHSVAGAPQQQFLFDLYRPDAWQDEFLTKAHGTMRAELTAIRDLLAANDIALFVAFIPTIESVADAAGEPAPKGVEGLALQHPSEKIRALFAELELDAVDLTPVLSARGSLATYSPWNRHFVAKGNEVAAQTIIETWTALKPALSRANRSP